MTRLEQAAIAEKTAASYARVGNDTMAARFTRRAAELRAMTDDQYAADQAERHAALAASPAVKATVSRLAADFRRLSR